MNAEDVVSEYERWAEFISPNPMPGLPMSVVIAEWRALRAENERLHAQVASLQSGRAMSFTRAQVEAIIENARLGGGE